ncbi:MAG: zinc-ribbon domain-containing protein [Gemmatimonadales bacterium]
MNVRCPSCETVYRVDPKKVPSVGIRARCGSCAAIISIQATEGEAVAPAPPVVPAAVESLAAARPAEPAAAMSPPQPEATSAPAPVLVHDESEAVAEPPPPPPSPGPRLSRPFVQPRPDIMPPPAPQPAPARPSAPVFRPTPGTPVAEPAVPKPLHAAPMAEQAPSAPAVTQPRRPINPFLSKDPSQKARRLARALVSDMIVYQPKKRQDALHAGNLKTAFEEEIKKSWEEYVEQVGEDVANSTPYFTEALNDILAGGQKVF